MKAKSAKKASAVEQELKRANTVFLEVQAALLNSDCDPFDAARQALCALFAFVETEVDGCMMAAMLRTFVDNFYDSLTPYLQEKLQEAGFRRPKRKKT